MFNLIGQQDHSDWTVRGAALEFFCKRNNFIGHWSDATVRMFRHDHDTRRHFMFLAYLFRRFAHCTKSTIL
jgi:hypothetical protein